MFLSLLTFDLAPDLGAASSLRSAFSRIPNGRICVAGTMKRLAGDAPDHAGGALLLCDDSDAAQSLADPSRASALFEGTTLDAATLHVESIAATAEIPFAPCATGQRCYALIASFNYAPGPGDAVAAERHYLDYHVPRSRELAELRAYYTGRIRPEGTRGTPRQRMGVEVWDSRESLARAFRSPLGLELRKDGEYVCADVRVHHFDGEVLFNSSKGSPPRT